jgi:hypothetical protein
MLITSELRPPLPLQRRGTKEGVLFLNVGAVQKVKKKLPQRLTKEIHKEHEVLLISILSL